MTGKGRAPIHRRRVLAGAGALAATLLLLPARPRAALLPTPGQTPGPFYPRLLPDDIDTDLVRLGATAEAATGQEIHVAGRLLDTAGRPLAGLRLELWQADNGGRYRHPAGGGEAFDPAFQGFGRVLADADGGWSFRTIRPAAYGNRPPHLHFAVWPDGQRPFTTQMYFEGEPRNATDGILNGVTDPARRASLIVRFAPGVDFAPGVNDASDVPVGHFDIVLDPGQTG